MSKKREIKGKEILETIENRWDVLYRDYPEIYEKFARIPKQPTVFEVIQQHFPLEGKTILDVGSGTGLSTFELAKYAHYVIGIEPETSMRDIAIRTAQDQNITNVRFMEGRAEDLPLDDESVDIVTAIGLASLHNEENIMRFIQESERVVRKGGIVLTANLASRWYGGELTPVILNKPREEMQDNIRDRVFPRYRYKHIDFFSTQDYGTVENAVKTYGFIHGRNAIEYIKKHKKTVIKWKARIHYKTIL